MEKLKDRNKNINFISQRKFQVQDTSVNDDTRQPFNPSIKN